jgi:integrase
MAINKANFTAERITGFKCPSDKQQSIYWDAKYPGLGVRVTAKGAKSFVYEGRLHGKTLRLTIGNAKAWPIGKAQTEAARLKTLIDQGIDPRQLEADKKSAFEATRLEAKRKSITLREAWESYIEARRPRWSELNYRDHVDVSRSGGEAKKRGKGVTEPGPLALLMTLRLCELTPEKMADWLTHEAERRPARARLAFNLLRIFSKWCESKPEYRGLIDAQSMSTRLSKDALPKRQAKNDAIEREQLAPWFAAVQQLSNPVMSAYLIGLLVTGARREELAGLRWQDVDFQWRRLTIRDKVEGTRDIPLPPYFASHLLSLKRANEAPPNVRQLRRLTERGEEWQPSPWVFFSKTAADGRLAAPNSALHRACKLAGIPPITLHGLRRSFASLAEWTETPTGIVAQIMGHKPSATAERHYKVRPIDLLRAWHDKLEAWILEQAKIDFPGLEIKPELRVIALA